MANMLEEEVLCPKLADEEIIIAVANMDSLKLSSYERVPGTKVFLSCLSKLTHVLNGTITEVECLQSGQWDAEIPSCVRRGTTDGTGGTGDGDSTGRDTSEDDGFVMLPYVIALVAMALICILVIVLLAYILYNTRKSKNDNSDSVYNSCGASSGEQMDFWVEMAGPRHFRCHELASTHDTMVHSLRYTNTYPGWSGY